MERSERLIGLIQSILPKFDQVAASWTDYDGGYNHFADVVSKHALEMEVCALADHIYGKDHPSSDMIKSAAAGTTLQHLQSAQGLLIGTASALRNGLLEDLKTQILLDVQGDFIEAARVAIENGSKDVAAALLCVVLEDSVKRLAKKTGHEYLLSKEYGVVVVELFKVNAIAKSTKGVLLSYTDLRNASLHAQWHEVSAEAVQNLLSFLPVFIELHGI